MLWNHKFLSDVTGCRKTQVLDCTSSTVYTYFKQYHMYIKCCKINIFMGYIFLWNVISNYCFKTLMKCRCWTILWYPWIQIIFLFCKLDNNFFPSYYNRGNPGHDCIVQLTLVVSNSVDSNFRLSRIFIEVPNFVVYKYM